MKYAKFNKDKEEIVKHFINKELEPFGKTYADILGVQDWFQLYPVSEEQYEKWKQYCIKYLRENYGFAKKRAETEMAWFGLQWGLSINYGDIKV